LLKAEGEYKMGQGEGASILLLAATMVLWGAAPVVEKLGLEGTDPLTGLLIRSTSVTVALFVLFLVTGRLHQLPAVPGRSILFFAAAGLLAGLLGTWTYYAVLKTGALSQVVPIAAAFPLVTTLAAVLIFKEQVTPLRIVGTCLVILGIILVKRG
jgi:bacterial/archaeal transporter family protein